MSEPRREEFLRAVLDRLLPAYKELPGAGSLGLAARVEQELKVDEHWAGARKALARLPEDFHALDGTAQDGALRTLERTAPQAFAQLVELAYGAYYTDARVLRWVERETGYGARPPQPLGYELAPFDEARLATVRCRPPFYRQV